jgi:alpha-glucosidase (family GH31 glycosyl hydrolase)
MSNETAYYEIKSKKSYTKNKEMFPQVWAIVDQIKSKGIKWLKDYFPFGILDEVDSGAL